MSGLKKLVFFGFGFVLVASVALRMLLVDAPAGATNPMSASARAFATNVGVSAPEAKSFVETALPFVTEASLFGLIGFALGFTSRKVFKILLVLIALGFVAIQVLVSTGKLQVDWSAVIHAIDHWILNVDVDVSVPTFLKQRLPTLAAFVIGYVFGLRKG